MTDWKERIERLPLRAKRFIAYNRIENVEQLAAFDVTVVRMAPNVGQQALHALDEILVSYGMPRRFSPAPDWQTVLQYAPTDVMQAEINRRKDKP